MALTHAPGDSLSLLLRSASTLARNVTGHGVREVFTSLVESSMSSILSSISRPGIGDLDSYYLQQFNGPSHGALRPFECPFWFLRCSYTSFDEDEWTTHTLSHFYPSEPPRNTSCPIESCHVVFTSTEPGEAWSQRMSHVADHHRDGATRLDSKPDYALFKHLWNERLISDEEYVGLEVNRELRVMPSRAAALERRSRRYQSRVESSRRSSVSKPCQSKASSSLASGNISDGSGLLCSTSEGDESDLSDEDNSSCKTERRNLVSRLVVDIQREIVRRVIVEVQGLLNVGNVATHGNGESGSTKSQARASETTSGCSSTGQVKGKGVKRQAEDRGGSDQQNGNGDDRKAPSNRKGFCSE